MKYISMFRGLILVWLCVTLTHEVGAQNAFFLRVSGISGESTATNHIGDMDATGFSWGVATASSGGGGVGPAQFTSLSVTKYIDKASPLLMLNSARGNHFTTVAFFVQSASPNPRDYYKITLTDVIINAVSNTGDANGRPTEAVSFSFGRIQIEYTPRKADGTYDTPVSACWDLQKASSC